MTHGWLITRDYTADEYSNAKGVYGPSTTTYTADEIRHHPDARTFRLLDDDGNLMAKGLYVGDDSEDLFAPLDDYGEAMWGCTEIQYKNKRGEWEAI